MKTRPAKLGTVWTAVAVLYNADGKRVGRCIDTPNAIAKALMERPEASLVKSLSGVAVRSEYASRMNKWNEAKSGFVAG